MLRCILLCRAICNVTYGTFNYVPTTARQRRSVVVVQFDAVSMRYRQLYQQAGDIDELLFLRDDVQLRVPTTSDQAQ